AIRGQARKGLAAYQAAHPAAG
ncbi:DUF4440 domain-containing protein, partial [Pseudomonas aeruginosa]|nr:DUF4440 domain-containing protein [Pseudomonas aeruginosa]MBF3058489.1 DUF4440 domain-containing protein [Pseudomonas aeruginosa]MBF3092740.1 DUF4440 domain-containing protein [Pseudomonas aeruginosa]MBF3128637.1 DUF4440 domain-containing protein [Pseudomonas aeruginosa]MBF3156549.1 DUF4440 domain-containing protein [Pseudomonas aeruginosa]